jgi:hypothetical protein
MLNTEELSDLFSDTHTPLVFSRRPDPIPGDLRHGWRLAELVLVLDRCHASSANVEQLHLLVWAIRSKSTREMVQSWMGGEKAPDEFAVRYDPVLSRTIAIAISCGLVYRKPSQAISLTPNGKSLARSVWSNDEVMAEEKDFLRTFPGKISQKSIRQLMDWN